MAKERKVLVTPVFRGSYCNLLKPRKIEEDSEPKYSILMLLPKNSKKVKAFLVELREMAAEVMKAKFGKVIAESKLKYPLVKDGDEEASEEEGENPNAGHWLINASNKFKPGIINMAHEDLNDETEVYSGAWYRCTIDVWAWSNKWGKGVSVNLNNVQKVKDDEPFTGRQQATDDFREFKEDGDEDEDEMLG